MAAQKRVFALDVPAIHALSYSSEAKTWMPGTRPGMTEDNGSATPADAVQLPVKGLVFVLHLLQRFHRL